MFDPITNKQLAELTIQEFLRQAERERLAREVPAPRHGLLSRVGRFASNWVRRVKTPAPKPLRTTSAEIRS